VSDDPYEVLGVAPSADADQLAAARRRQALRAHPDTGGSDADMQRVNAAYELALSWLDAPAAPEAAPRIDPEPAAPSRSRRGRPQRRVVRDEASFTIDALPVAAFEALLVVATWMGEVLVDDPPYVLETFLHDPEPCWCRLDLVPDAGGSTVALTVAGVDDEPAPEVDDVRDVWVANLNRLGTTP